MHSPDTLNLQHLNAVLQVANLGSITRASERVHRSQSALTMAIRKIEGTIGALLFERHATGMSVTDAGRILASRIERAFNCLENGVQSLPARNGRHSRPVLSRAVTSTQLRALVAIVQQGGFSPAARLLGRSQPSVHRAARDLETVLDTPLFRVGSAGVAEPTREAWALARFASLAFQEIEQGLEEIANLRGRVGGRLRVASLPLARAEFLPESIDQILGTYPDLRVSIVDGPYDELLNELRMGQVDLILGALRSPKPAADVHQELLFEDPLSIVVRSGHPLLDRHRVKVGDLAKLAWVMPRAGTPAREHIASYFARSGVIAPSRIVECSSLVTTRGLLLNSDRAALLSFGQVRIEVERGLLAVLKRDLPGTRRPIGLTTRLGWKPTPIQAEYVRLLRPLARHLGN